MKIKKMLLFFLMLAQILLLISCANNPMPNKQNTDTASSGSESTKNNIKIAYKNALKNLLEDSLLPDGTKFLFDTQADKSENKYAIFDVNNDGEDELILLLTGPDVAGNIAYIVSYNQQTNTFETQLEEYPSLTFYDNNMVRVDWSHNQGKGGADFWPFNLYQYNADTKSYSLVMTVDSWDKNVLSEEFPDDIDKSGTGVVYYVAFNDEFDYSKPIDAQEYENLVDKYLKNAKVIEVPYFDLTLENIEK